MVRKAPQKMSLSLSQSHSQSTSRTARKANFIQVDKVKIKDPIQMQFVKDMRKCGYKVVFLKAPDGSYEGPAISLENNNIEIIRDISHSPVTTKDDHVIVNSHQ